VSLAEVLRKGSWLPFEWFEVGKWSLLNSISCAKSNLLHMYHESVFLDRVSIKYRFYTEIACKKKNNNNQCLHWWIMQNPLQATNKWIGLSRSSRWNVIYCYFIQVLVRHIKNVLWKMSISCSVFSWPLIWYVVTLKTTVLELFQ